MAANPEHPSRTGKHHADPSRTGSRRRRAHRRRQRPTVTTAHTSLDSVASAFWLLTHGPDPLSVDGAEVGHGLPRRRIPLPQLRAMLLHPSTSRECRDAAWRLIVLNARAGTPAWVVGAAGVALPALSKIARDLTDGYRGDPADVHSAALAGFVTALHRIDVDRPGVITRLRWAAYRAAIVARYTRDGIQPAPSSPPESSPPPYPWGHPDLVLLDAVAKGVLSPLQAELIGRSRLEDLSLKDAAAELGVGYEAACKARQRGEARLVAAINSGHVEKRLSAPPVKSGLSSAGGRHLKPGGVRGSSTESDGTSDSDRALPEGGAFCSPARHPTAPAGPSASSGRPRRRSGRPRGRRGHSDGSGGATS